MASTMPLSTAIRNIAIVGHSGAGKTTLAEGLLHRAGVIPRLGTIEDGTTVTDHEPEEHARGISVSVGIAHLEWKADDVAHDVTVLDTPGYPDFIGSVDAALSVADAALVVVSAVHGVQAGTLEAWRRCAELGVPRIVVVTKEDRARADFRAVVAELRDEFGEAIMPVQLPLGEEHHLRGVLDVLDAVAWEHDSAAGGHSVEIPAELSAEQEAAHAGLVEEIVTYDDELLERYLSGDEPPAHDVWRTMARMVHANEAFPVVLCSGLNLVGIDRVLDTICRLAPSPADRPATVAVIGGEEPTTVIPADPQAPALLSVFRTVVDPFVGHVSVFKVLSGSVGPGDRLTNTATGADERLHGLFVMRGRDHDTVERVEAGRIAAVAKLADTPSPSLLAARRLPITAVPPPDRPPVYRLALKPVTQADDDKLSSALARLRVEDPTLHLDLTGSQAVIGGLGDTHLAVVLDKLARSFGVHVETEAVAVPYLETIRRAVEVEGKLKKQSGGHGQFAVVHLRVSPLPSGTGFEFVDSVVGGAVPRQYISAVEKGAADAMADGGPHGFPIVDLRVELFDGKSHAVDSSDMAFRSAAAIGVREAMASAGSQVLEPLCAVRVVVPVEAQGDVMGDLSARRGRITATDMVDSRRAVIEAHVPVAELARYVLDLRSITGGRASFTMEHLGYEPLIGTPVVP